MNALDKIISGVSPQWGLNRLLAKKKIKALSGYEAATQSGTRKRTDASTGDAVMAKTGMKLAYFARDLDRNHDLAKGVLDVMVKNIVGSGIRPEPQLMTVGGEPLTDVNEQLLYLHEDFSKRASVCKENYYIDQRLMCRSWLRDGEVFKKRFIGQIPNLKHGSIVPFSYEIIEMDMLPFSYTEESKNIIHGVQKNGWGEPVMYWFYKETPTGSLYLRNSELRGVSANLIDHLRLTDRIGQTRGASVFASVLNRLDDISQYEESEQVAARVAATMVGYIKKGSPDFYNADDEGKDYRSIDMEPGLVFDDLRPGEDVGTIDHSRPNSGLQDFRNSMLRAVASGTMSGYSSISKDYDGSYSSQRQELVENDGFYKILWDTFVAKVVDPDWVSFVNAAISSGAVDIPTDLDERTLYAVTHSRPAIPWIDPNKESSSQINLIEAGLMSENESIRSRDKNPTEVRRQIKTERANKEKELPDEELVSDNSEET